MLTYLSTISVYSRIFFSRESLLISLSTNHGPMRITGILLISVLSIKLKFYCFYRIIVVIDTFFLWWYDKHHCHKDSIIFKGLSALTKSFIVSKVDIMVSTDNTFVMKFFRRWKDVATDFSTIGRSLDFGSTDR